MAKASAISYSTVATVIPTDADHPDSIIVSDPELLFTGDYRRAGPDLVLTGHDGYRHIVSNYFAGGAHAALVAPNGASLSADLVGLLAGSPAPGQYAQAQTTAPADVIGKIEKVVGHAVVMRNGATVALNVGAVVHKGDVIETGPDSLVGITFPDGTALNLVANTRMALNDYSYEPNGGANGALFSLVEGTFAFVAGQVAHTGDGLKITTPVATMGIRGTAGWAGHQIPVISSTFGDVYAFALAHDPGVTSSGRYLLYATDLNGNLILDQNGNPIVRDTVGNLDTLALCTIDRCTDEPMTSGLAAFGQNIMRGAYDASQSVNPRSNPGGNGSGNPPFSPQFLPENGNDNHTFNFFAFPVINIASNQAAPPFTYTAPPLPATQQPLIAVPASTQTLLIDKGTAISGVGVSESGSTSGETFTVTVSDNRGLLSATATGAGDTVAGVGTTSLTIVGTLNQVNADLETLSLNDTAPGLETLTVSATDSLGHSATPATIAVTILDTTTVSERVLATLRGDENTAIALSSIKVSDTPTRDDALTTTLAVSHGTITVGATDGATVTISDGGATVTLTGTAAQINAALATASYTGKSNFYGSDSLAVTTTDVSSGSSVTKTVGITLGDTTTVSERVPASLKGDENTAIALSGIKVSDTPNIEDTLTTTLTTSHGTITVGNASGTTVTSSGGSGGGSTVTLTGTAAQINAALATASYTPSSNFNGSDRLSVTTADASSGSSVTKTALITISDESNAIFAPPSIAGNAVNLALTDGRHAPGPVALTFTAIPLDWSLNEGPTRGKGSWTVERSDSSTLAIMTAAAYAGAMVLDGTESPAKTSGSAESATVADDLEARALGAPIVALSSSNSLTGIGGNDLFLFSHPTGSDAVYNFNPASDKIDLIGFSSVSSRGEIHLSNNASGNAVIKVDNGPAIPLQGFHSVSVTASNLIHNQTPVIDRGDTFVFDPVVTTSSTGPFATASAKTSSVSLDGPGNDNFVFHAGTDPRVDTIELDHSHSETRQQLASIMATDAHAHAAIEFGHNDGITIPGVTATYLQAHLHSLFHLH